MNTIDKIDKDKFIQLLQDLDLDENDRFEIFITATKSFVNGQFNNRLFAQNISKSSFANKTNDIIDAIHKSIKVQRPKKAILDHVAFAGGLSQIAGFGQHDRIEIFRLVIKSLHNNNIDYHQLRQLLNDSMYHNYSSQIIDMTKAAQAGVI